MHTTRNEMPESWPISKKGTKYLGISNHAKKESIPFARLMKDILKLAKTRKEVKHILSTKKIKINGRIIIEEKFPVQIADIISLGDSGKTFRAIIKNKKFSAEEVKGKDTQTKIVKVIGKRLLQGKKIQLNLRDGQNIITNEKIAVGDSILLNFDSKKIERVFPLKEGCNIEVISGGYMGKEGKLIRVEERQRKKVYVIKLDKKEIGVGPNFIKVTE